MAIEFSILVPVYNVERYIRNSILSVLKQSYNNFELILVDDGSTDQSGLICDELAKNDERIQVLHQENHGLIYTRRVAFNEAKGDYCVILDSDDTLKEDTLEILYSTIVKYHSDCIIYGFERVYEGKILSQTSDTDIIHLTSKRDIYMKVFLDSDYNAIWRKAFKRSLLDGRDYSRYYHLSLGEDLLQSIEVLGNAKSVTFLPNILYEYTMNPSSMTKTVTADNYKWDVTIRKEVWNFLTGCGELSQTDLLRYKSNCLLNLYKEVVRVSKFKCSTSKKISILERFSGEEYYSTLLNGRLNTVGLSLRHKLILLLLKKKKYKLIINVCSLKQ